MADNACELITSLEEQWRDALCAQDMDRLGLLVHRDFQLIGTRSTGPFTMNREEWLEAIQRREIDDIELHISQATVREHVMIGTVEAHWRLKYLGRVIEDCVLLTDIWIYDDGRWQVLRRHSTPVPATSGPRS